MILGQIHDPNANWFDTPEVLRTPKQQGDMYIDIVVFGWPIFCIALGLALLWHQCDSRHRNDRAWYKVGGWCLIAVGAIGIYFTYFW